jgi:hypothetical protein
LPGYNEDVNELRAAKAWGMNLREWCAESVDDRGRMLAYVLYEAKIESYRQWWREQKREREEGKDRDENTFRAMKQRMRGVER